MAAQENRQSRNGPESGAQAVPGRRAGSTPAGSSSSRLGWWHAVLWPLAILGGLGAFAIDYGEGLSYLSADPEACANCHIMRPRLESYLKASHHTAATCVDCHLPRSFFPKYIAKARNGWNHTVAFTTGRFHEPIVIKPYNSRVLQENCHACHGTLVHDLVIAGDLRCVHCHVDAGHGELAGLGGPERGR